MNYRERENERKKRIILEDYFSIWKWWLLSIVSAGASAIMYMFMQSMQFNELSMPIKLSLVFSWAFVVMAITLISFSKAGGLLLSMSSLFFIVGSLTNFEEPVMFLAVFTVITSVFLFFLEIFMGVRFTLGIKVKELPWCPNKESNKRRITKRSRTGGKDE